MIKIQICHYTYCGHSHFLSISSLFGFILLKQMIEKCQFGQKEQELFWSIKQFENSLRSITNGFMCDKDYSRQRGILQVNRQIENGLEEITQYVIFLKKLFPQLEQAENQITKVQAKIEDDQIGYNCNETMLSGKLEENISGSTGKKRGPYRYYTHQERAKVIELHLSGLTYAKISKDLKIPQKNIVRWCKEGLSSIQKRRRVIDIQMEQTLIIWIEECRMKRQHIKLIDLQRKALEIRASPFFKASRGWAISFSKRYNLKFTYNRE